MRPLSTHQPTWYFAAHPALPGQVQIQDSSQDRPAVAVPGFLAGALPHALVAFLSHDEDGPNSPSDACRKKGTRFSSALFVSDYTQAVRGELVRSAAEQLWYCLPR